MTTGRIILFVISLFFALVLTIPLSMALSLVGQGISARSATGTIWSGKLADARIGPLALGDVVIGLEPLRLLGGAAVIDLQSASGRSKLSSSRGAFTVRDATVNLDGSSLFAPLPVDRIDLSGVSTSFDAGKCQNAKGRVRATFSGDVGGLSLAQGLSGVARCEGPALMLPLVSQSAMERLNLYLQGDGGFRAEFIVRSTDPALATKLSAAGFAATPGGFVLRMAGKL